MPALKRLNIETDRLSIGNLREEHLHDFHFYRSKPEVCQYQGFEPMSPEQAAAFIGAQKDKLFGKPHEWVQYGIVLAETNRLAGDCAIRLLNEEGSMAEIGITISHTQQRKGFAKEAMLGILDFLFRQEGMRRVVEVADAENTASVRLLESTGFRREGHFIENIFFKGKWGSEVQYAMLRREWEAMTNKQG